MKKSLNRNSFGEINSKLIDRGSIRHNKSFWNHLFLDKMKVNLDMLSSVKKDWIGSHIDNVEFSKKRTNPTQFNNTICNSPVFKLNNGMKYNFFAL